MCSQTIKPDPYGSNEDWKAAGIVLPSSHADYRVATAEPTGALTLIVQHRDGVVGQVRFDPSALRGGLEPLNDPCFFLKVHVDNGAVTWPGEIDLAPDNMHRHLFAFGKWVLR